MIEARPRLSHDLNFLSVDFGLVSSDAIANSGTIIWFLQYLVLREAAALRLSRRKIFATLLRQVGYIYDRSGREAYLHILG